MRRTPREQLIYVVSILFAATPFAFALIRYFSTGSDIRYFWLAIASFLGATGVMAVGKARGRAWKGVFALSAVALVIATLLAGSVALLLGSTSGLGLWIVAFSFGLCSAAGAALHTLSRRQST